MEGAQQDAGGNRRSYGNTVGVKMKKPRQQPFKYTPSWLMTKNYLEEKFARIRKAGKRGRK